MDWLRSPRSCSLAWVLDLGFGSEASVDDGEVPLSLEIQPLGVSDRDLDRDVLMRGLVQRPQE